VRRWLAPLALLAGLIGLWQIAASSGLLADLLGLESYLVPSPAEIAESLWENRSLLAEDGWVTLGEIVLGFACAVAIGVLFAVAMHLSSLIKDPAYPLVVASQTIPVVVLSPILVIWFGYGIVPKLAIVALICFFPITVATYDGLRSVDPAAIKLMRSLDASRRQIFQRVEAPTALPSFFSGARIAVAIAPIGAVFGEWAGSSSGLGHLILQDLGRFETARMFAAVAVLSAIALSGYALIALAERFIVRWR
jgi:ABC-type nitrate/sulfonate/bicarbonate transport system permease component